MTLLYLWAIPITALALVACASHFRGAVRLFALGISVLLVWYVWAVYGAQAMADILSERKLKTDALGQVGDLFGGVNALFSALAFVGVAIAANFQYRSNRQAHIQAFESSFYNAVDLLHRITEGLRFDPRIIPNVDLNEVRRLAGLPLERPTLRTDPVVEGRAVFSEIARAIRSVSHTPEEALQQYRRLQDKHNYVLGHYFRHLYQVLKLIDRQSDDVLSKEQKQSYASTLRAQLSTSELALLLLNCSDNVVDAGQFRNLLVRYSFLEHLPFRRTLHGYAATESYLPIATPEGMQRFLAEHPIPPQTKRKQGAFGQNPVVVEPHAPTR